MTTKKLNAMYATASDEEKQAIAQELAEREAAQTAEAKPQEYNNPDYTPTPEDEAAWAEAEKNGGKVPTKARRTEEELLLLAEQLKDKVGHRCVAVVPAIGPEKLTGTIIAVVANKSAAQAFYTIKLDNGKKTSKAWDSPLIEILEEVVEVADKRTSTKKKEEWTDESLKTLMDSLSCNIGKLVTLEDGRQGRIISLVPDKRTQVLMYRISVDGTTEDGQKVTTMAYRVYTSTGITIEADFDEDGKALNDKYVARREKAANKVEKEPTDPREKLATAKLALEKAETSLAKAQELVEKRRKAVEAAEAEVAKLKESEAAEATETETTEENTTGESLL